jgi:hypothetical protein
VDRREQRAGVGEALGVRPQRLLKISPTVPVAGSRPHANSKSTSAAVKTSLFASSGRPCICSGERNASAMPRPALRRVRASAKPESTARPSGVTKTLRGETSR